MGQHDPEKMLEMTQVQQQVRQNAEDLQSYFSDLYKWEQSIERNGRQKDARMHSVKTPSMRSSSKKDMRATSIKSCVLKESNDGSLTDPVQKSREEIERENGNANYKNGNYTAAIECYTKCLGLDSKNAVVLSNRAMALIKNNEFVKAEVDCTAAIAIDPAFTKSYLRRGTARNALGKHRLALLDFTKALLMDPTSKEIASQIAKTQDAIRSSIKRAPKIVVPVRMEANDEHGLDDRMEGKPQVKISLKVDVIKDHKDDLSEVKVVESCDRDQNAHCLKLLEKTVRKAPSSSYEFCRVWKSLSPLRCTTSEFDKTHLNNLKIKYLSTLDPEKLPKVFKSSIEPEILCEIFSIFRHSYSTFENPAFVQHFVASLPNIPRFQMISMFLEQNDKENIRWILSKISPSFSIDECAKLMKPYEHLL